MPHQHLSVKNTFIHFQEEADGTLSRSQSAPAIMTTQQNQEELEKIHQKLREFVAKLNPTNSQRISVEQYLAEEFNKNPDNFDFSQFDFLRCNVAQFGFNQAQFNSAVESLDQMKKLHEFLNQNTGKTITGKQLEEYATPPTSFTYELISYYDTKEYTTSPKASKLQSLQLHQLT